MPEFGRFVRVPTELLEALLRAGLAGGQLRVILWVVRNTYGWNRAFTPFSWYRVANELRMNRSAVYRAGQALLRARVLTQREDQLGVCTDFDGRTALNLKVANKQQKAFPYGNADVADAQQERCKGASLFRQAKDSRKDNSKTYKERPEERPEEGTRDPAITTSPHLSKNSRPAAKYDSLSEN
jgi:phage replication O-like protein O